ncbi:MAG: LAGLIDADG family homing endonuclease [Nitrososphaerales archaeon]|nr:LAGLIDADG family homing endonuclease [Nitrososphaerales archaeon]
MSGGLAWPPKKEDLEQLYVGRKLSAAKIAYAYGLKGTNPKSDETLVLYYLRKYRIQRRDRAKHIRKVTEEMVEDWIRRYNGGESLRQIAGSRLDPVTVFYHLKRRGVQLRDKVEAQIKAVTKHEKHRFDGTTLDQAYLLGLAKGDFYVTTHGRSIRVKTGTTHPAMTRLFRDVFSRYGPVYEYPRPSRLTPYEWSLDCDLDASFRFLLEFDERIAKLIKDRKRFFAFLAGLFDAEGSVYLHKKKRWGAFEFSLANTNRGLLRSISARLSEEGYSPTLRRNRQSPRRGVKNGSGFIWRLTLWRYGDVSKLLKALPLRHPEKAAKVEIALRLGYRPTDLEREQVIGDWEVLKKQIRRDRDDYVEMARKSLNISREG